MKTDKETLEAILQLYIDKDCQDTRLSQPFEQNGYIFASECHFLIKIPAAYLPGVYPSKVTSMINISGINADANCKRHITVSSLRSKLNHPNVPTVDVFDYMGEDKKCKECCNGQVEWRYTDRSGRTYYDFFDCPICDGSGYTSRRKRTLTGEKIKDPNAIIRLKPGVNIKHKFLNSLLKTMYLLEVEECIWTTQSPNSINIFKLKDITVMIMPFVL